MSDRFVVLEKNKKLYFVRKDRVEEIENVSVCDTVFKTKKNANDYIVNKIKEIESSHSNDSYKSVGNDGGMIALLNEKGRIVESHHLNIVKVFESEN